MSRVRKPAVAGMFYPADPRQLAVMVQDYLRSAQAEEAVPKAIIAPHAGYIYSGPVAATAYRQLAKDRAGIRRIVLLGPSHRVPFYGLALSSADYFETPLGRVPLDREAMDTIRGLPAVQVLDDAHAMEHSLEVHLPFLQEALDDFHLVPIVVGDASPSDVAGVLDRLWDGHETRFVISSDLSHYHDYETARRLDRATSQAIEALRPEDIQYEDACGRNPINGLLYASRKRGLHAKTLDLRNSGDTAGPKNEVVGYGAYTFEESPRAD